MSADERLPRSPGPALRDEFVAPDWSGDRPAYPLFDLVTDGRSLASLLEMAARGTLKLSCDLDALTPPPSGWLVWNAAPMLLSDGTTAEARKWGRVCNWAPTSGLAAIYMIDRSWRLVAADGQPTVRVVHCRPPRGFTLECSEPHPLLPLGEIAPASPVTWADLGLTGVVNPERGPGAPVAVEDLWVQHDDAVAAGLVTSGEASGARAVVETTSTGAVAPTPPTEADDRSKPRQNGARGERAPLVARESRALEQARACLANKDAWHADDGRAGRPKLYQLEKATGLDRSRFRRGTRIGDALEIDLDAYWEATFTTPRPK